MAYNLIVAYDLKEGADYYEEVENAVKDLGNWAHFELSVWYVRSNYTPAEARNRVWQAMRSRDKLFVADMKDAAWCGLVETASDYIKNQWV